MTIIRMLFEEEQGQGMVEYVLTIGLVALVVLVAIAGFGNGLSGSYENMATDVSTHLP